MGLGGEAGNLGKGTRPFSTPVTSTQGGLSLHVQTIPEVLIPFNIEF